MIGDILTCSAALYGAATMWPIHIGCDLYYGEGEGPTVGPIRAKSAGSSGGAQAVVVNTLTVCLGVFVRSSSEPHDRVLVVQHARAGCPATATSNDSKHSRQATPAGLGRRGGYDVGWTRRLSIWKSVLSPRMPIRPGPLSGGPPFSPWSVTAKATLPTRMTSIVTEPSGLSRATPPRAPVPGPRRPADRRAEQEVAAALDARVGAGPLRVRARHLLLDVDAPVAQADLGGIAGRRARHRRAENAAVGVPGVEPDLDPVPCARRPVGVAAREAVRPQVEVHLHALQVLARRPGPEDRGTGPGGR